MDEEKRYALERIVGRDKENRIYKLLDFVDGEKMKGKEIEEPWYTRDFDLCFENDRKRVRRLICVYEGNF